MEILYDSSDLDCKYSDNYKLSSNCSYDDSVKKEFMDPIIDSKLNCHDLLSSECVSKPVTVKHNLQLGITSSSSESSDLKSVPLHSQSKIHRIRSIRYAGDMTDLSRMSRTQLENCVQICKRKIENNASTIKSLRRQVKAKDRNITALRGLVKELKSELASSERITESFEVDFKIVDDYE